MVTYLKIVSAIVMALVLLSGVVGAINLIHGLYAGEAVTGDFIVYPLIVAAMGFVMFGVIGSLLWGLFYELLYRLERRPLVRHAAAAALAALAVYLGFVVLAVFGSSSSGHGAVWLMSVPLTVTVAISVLCYWWLYLRRAICGA